MFFKKNVIIPIICFTFFYLFSCVVVSGAKAESLGGLEKTAQNIGYATISPDMDSNLIEGTIALKIGVIINTILTLLGIVFMVITWIGALVITGANGNEEEIKKGRNWIKNGFIGMIVIFVAYILTKAILLMVKGESLGGIFKI